MNQRRQIKFRGKRLDNGEWIYGSLVVLAESKSAIIISNAAPYEDDNELSFERSSGSEWAAVDFDTIGECTNCFDRKVNPIYEDDYILGYRVGYPKTPELWHVEYVSGVLRTRRLPEKYHDGRDYAPVEEIVGVVTKNSIDDE